MSDKPENGLKQELDRRKRINRIKSIIVSLVGIWMLASVILCATLFVKVIHLENNLNKDGSVNIPEKLQPYMGGTKILMPKN